MAISTASAGAQPTASGGTASGGVVPVCYDCGFETKKMRKSTMDLKHFRCYHCHGQVMPNLQVAFNAWNAMLGGNALQAWIAAVKSSQTSKRRRFMKKAFRGWMNEHPEVDDHGHTTGETKTAEYIYLHHGGPR